MRRPWWAVLSAIVSVITLAGGGLLLVSPAAAEDSTLHFDSSVSGRVEIRVGAQLVATYLYDHPQLTRPAFVNIMAPTGRRITRHFPVTAADDNDHEWIHSALWLSFGDINGHDYWRLKARVRHRAFVVPPEVGKETGRFAVESEYLSTDGARVVCRERADYTFQVRNEGLLIRARYELRPTSEPLVFGDQEEIGLGVRMRSELRVRGGSGTITNSAGAHNEQQVWGKEIDWLDYSGDLEGRRLGALVMPSPRNPRRSWAHCRDYGVMVLNPFLHQPQLDPRPAAARVGREDKLELSYAVLFYDVPAEKPVAPAEVYAEVQAQPDALTP